jgi:integrase
MRTGEVCGLTWDDIDFEKETINIQHNVYDKPKDGKGRWYKEYFLQYQY